MAIISRKTKFSHFSQDKIKFCMTQKLNWHLWRQNAAVLRVYKFYVAIYCTRIYLSKRNFTCLSLYKMQWHVWFTMVFFNLLLFKIYGNFIFSNFNWLFSRLWFSLSDLQIYEKREMEGKYREMISSQDNIFPIVNPIKEE